MPTLKRIPSFSFSACKVYHSTRRHVERRVAFRPGLSSAQKKSKAAILFFIKKFKLWYGVFGEVNFPMRSFLPENVLILPKLCFASVWGSLEGTTFVSYVDAHANSTTIRKVHLKAVFSKKDLRQACPKSGPQAKCGPWSNFDRPMAWFIKWMEYGRGQYCRTTMNIRGAAPQMYILPLVALLAKTLDTPDLRFGAS